MLDTLAREPANRGKQTQPVQTQRRSRLRLAVRCAVIAVAAMFVAQCLRIFAGGNFHSVVAGKCYRSGQPTAELLETLHQTHHIKAIVNLRDENEGEPWYDEEKEAADRLGIKLVNAGLCGAEMTPAHDFARFVKALHDSPEPLLIHCASGNDRTGLASVMYLLMKTDTPLREARQQLSLRYGHFSFGKAACLQRTLDNYEAWLASMQYEHTPDHLLHWSYHEYRQEQLPGRVAVTSDQ